MGFIRIPEMISLREPLHLKEPRRDEMKLERKYARDGNAPRPVSRTCPDRWVSSKHLDSRVCLHTRILVSSYRRWSVGAVLSVTR